MHLVIYQQVLSTGGRMKQCPRKRDIVARTMGAQLRARRIKLGVTLSSLAEKVGVSFQAIQKYECGSSLISVVHLADLCRALDTTPNYLFLSDNIGFFEDFEEFYLLELQNSLARTDDGTTGRGH